jgi:hypothetical protein
MVPSHHSVTSKDTREFHGSNVLLRSVSIAILFLSWRTRFESKKQVRFTAWSFLMDRENEVSAAKRKEYLQG